MTPALPPAILSSPRRTRRFVSLVGGLCAATGALGGCWPRFYDGAAVRLVLAIASFVLGMLVVRVGLARKWGAVASAAATFALAVPSGFVASAAVSLFASSAGGTHPLEIHLLYSAIFGPITGALYGLCLAMLVCMTHEDVGTDSHDGADRARRNAAMWLLVVAVFAGGVAQVFLGRGQKDEAALLACVLVAALAIVLLVSTERRYVRRARWMARVATGNDPSYETRPAAMHEDLSTLPRLTQGSRVVVARDAEKGYRAPTAGAPIAVIA